MDIMSDKDLFYQIHPGRGPALLLVHGFLSSQAQWQPNLPELGKVATPITVELFGHGRSPSPTEKGCYEPTYYMAQFEKIRLEIGARKWFVCGCSLGGGLTVNYAISHSKRILGHIFTNSTSAFSLPRENSPDPQEMVAHYEEGGIDAVEAIPVHPKYAKRLDPRISAALMEETKLLNPGGVGRTAAYTAPAVSVRDQVQDNRRPALLICGQEEDRFLEYRDFVEENMPRLKVCDLPGGHGVNLECADSFNEEVTHFIKEHV